MIDIKSSFYPLSASTPTYIGEVKLLHPQYHNDRFNAILGVDASGNIIHNTNSFLVDITMHAHMPIPGWFKKYEAEHNIFTNIELTYERLKSLPATITCEKEMFLLANPFCATNFGHDLSILLDRINDYKQKGYTCPVVVSEAMLHIPRSLEICILLLPNADFFFLKNNLIYNFKNLIVPQNEILNICKHNYLIKEVVNHAVCSVHNIEEYKDKKICLIKHKKNKNIVTKTTVYECEKTLQILKDEYGYIILEPEHTHISKVISYLAFAKKIITSTGAISYGNGIFFNPSADTIMLNAVPYYNKEHFKTIYLPMNLDTCTTKLLELLGEI